MQRASRPCLWSDTKETNGTMLAVESTAESPTLCIRRGRLAAGSTSVKVWWGDGTCGTYAGISSAKHTYAAPGERLVRISDDIASFAFTAAGAQTAERRMLREVLAFGSKITSVEGYAFNGCSNMRGVIELPNVETISDYAFGSVGGVEEFRFPKLKLLAQTSFYCAPSAVRLYADSATKIQTSFFEYYGTALRDLYLASLTCAAVRSMYKFPFRAAGYVRFHCSDGILRPDGTVEEE